MNPIGQHEQPTFTILIPTHNHGATLFYSVGSVLAQTRQDFEIFIVGDGAPQSTNELAAILIRKDHRIRFFENPKGERHGELHRHHALQHAQGRYICHLCDDDLWLPDHLETIGELLEDHDLAHTMQIEYTPNGQAHAWFFEATHFDQIEAMRRNETGFGLSSGAFRLDAYRKLAYGWRPAPKVFNTDLFMWLQFLDQPWCRAVSLPRPTVIHPSDVERGNWPTARRIEELKSLSARLSTEKGRRTLIHQVLEPLYQSTYRKLLNKSRALDFVLDLPKRMSEGPRPGKINATTSFDSGASQKWMFHKGGNGESTQLRGFHEWEGWGVWSNRGPVSLYLPCPAAGRTPGRLEIEYVLLAQPENKTFPIHVTVNGQDAITWMHREPGGQHTNTIDITPEMKVHSTGLLVELDMPDACSPKALGISEDPRILGIGLISISLMSSPADCNFAA